MAARRSTRTGARLGPALALVALGATGVAQVSSAAWDETYFPNHPVVSQSGETFDFYDDLIDGKIVVINFIYTSCPDICGLSTARMAWVRDEIDEAVGEKVSFYSISLDPENDTPERLEAYADAFEADDDWLFLTGDPAELEEIRWKLGERSRSLDEHRSDMVIGNDEDGFWRRTSLMGNLTTVVREIQDLDPEFRAVARPLASRTIPKVGGQQRELADAPGEALFLKACAACHTIGESDRRVGPDLHGVTWKRERDWLVRAIMEPGELRASGDPDMAALDAHYPGVVMPDLSLSADDTKDVLLYIAARSVEVNEARAEPHVHADGSLHLHHDETEAAAGPAHASETHAHAEHDHRHGVEVESDTGRVEGVAATADREHDHDTPTATE